MSDPKAPRPHDATDLVEDALLEQELERLESLGVEQLREEMRKKGIDPGRARAATARALGVSFERIGGGAGAPTGKVVDFAAARERRRGGRAVVYAAIAVAAAAALAAGSRWRQIEGRIDAYFNPAPTESPTPRPTAQPETHEPTPQEKAADLRREALVNVQAWYFGDALDELEDAKALDPEGDEAQAIQDARAACAAGIEARKAAKPSAKPGLQPGEKPLRKPIQR